MIIGLVSFHYDLNLLKALFISKKKMRAEPVLGNYAFR